MRTRGFVAALGALALGLAVGCVPDGGGGTGSTTTTTVAPSRQVAQLTAGGYDNCVLYTDGTVSCWGYNVSGQLGVGDAANVGDAPGEMGANLRRVDLGTGRTAVQIDAGANVNCAVLDNGALKCWGANDSGQLGQGDTAARGDQPGEMGDQLPPIDLGTGRTAKQVSAGNGHVCAILDDDTLKCWGKAAWGQLGLGTGYQGPLTSVGGVAGDMGDNLPVVNVGAGRHAVKVETGGLFTCAILDDGSTKCWGQGANGVLLTGDDNARGILEAVDTLPAINVGTGRTVSKISAGSWNACAILDSGELKCWGDGIYGGLGRGNTISLGDDPGELGDGLPAVDLGTGRHAVDVQVGDRQVCAVLDNATVKCWGGNQWGELGIGSTNKWGDTAGETVGDSFTPIALGTGVSVASVWPGTNHTCVRTTANAVKCWGYGPRGVLGLGDEVQRGDGPGEMGDALPFVDVGV